MKNVERKENYVQPMIVSMDVLVEQGFCASIQCVVEDEEVEY